MNLYELTKKYGEGNGEEMMWKAVKIISDSVEKDMDDKAKHELMRRIYGAMSDCHYNEEYAIEDVEGMFYIDEAGEMHYAPYWTVPQVKEVYESVKATITAGYNFWDFYVALQMQKSDMYPMLKKWFPNATAEQIDKMLVEAAVNWLNDADNPYGYHKVWSYVNAGK